MPARRALANRHLDVERRRAHNVHVHVRLPLAPGRAARAGAHVLRLTPQRTTVAAPQCEPYRRPLHRKSHDEQLNTSTADVEELMALEKEKEIKLLS